MTKEQKNLTKLLDEGFTDTGRTNQTYNIYAKETERVFYNKYEDKIICRFDIEELMKGTI